MTEEQPLVSVLIVSYNTRDLLAECLGSVLADGSGEAIEVIVVDNASTDGSADLVADQFPSVALVRSPANLGFAAGVNEAAARARGQYLLLLNPDCQLFDDTIDALVDAAHRHPDAGVVGGRSVRADGSLDRRSCWGQPSPWSLFCFGTGLSTAFAGSARFDPETLGDWPRDDERTVGAVSGALLLIERSLWIRLGGFDDDYFMYSEDIDLAVRAAGAGRRAMITPSARAIHLGGASSRSSADKMVLVMAGKATFIRKHWSGTSRRFGLAMLWTGTGLRAALQRVGRRRPSAGSAAWTDVWAARHRWLAGYPAALGPSARQQGAGRSPGQ